MFAAVVVDAEMLMSMLLILHTAQIEIVIKWKKKYDFNDN